MSDNLIASSPVIRGGEPCIAGTRFPVWHIQEMDDAGLSSVQMCLRYPVLLAHTAGIAAAIAYPRRREIVAFGDVEGVCLVRESWLPDEVVIEFRADDGDVSEPRLPYHAIPSLIAALEQARGWEPAP